MSTRLCDCCQAYPALFNLDDPAEAALCHPCQRHTDHSEPCPYKSVVPLEETMRNIEAAVQAYCEAEGFISPLGGAHDAMRAALAAQFVADYGCEHCGGTNWMHVRSLDLETGIEQAESPDFNCAAEHVELPNPYDGTTVYADPARCEWRPECGMNDFACKWRVDHPIADDDPVTHEDCRYVSKPLEVDSE